METFIVRITEEVATELYIEAEDEEEAEEIVENEELGDCRKEEVRRSFLDIENIDRLERRNEIRREEEEEEEKEKRKIMEEGKIYKIMEKKRKKRRWN